MLTGTLKWFNPTKGYGFIVPDKAGPDVFLHASEVERAGLKLVGGEKLHYDVAVARKGQHAVKIRFPS